MKFLYVYNYNEKIIGVINIRNVLEILIQRNGDYYFLEACFDNRTESMISKRYKNHEDAQKQLEYLMDKLENI